MLFLMIGFEIEALFCF